MNPFGPSRNLLRFQYFGALQMTDFRGEALYR